MTRLFNKAVAVFLLALIDAYKLFISPYLGRNCRFEPGCSTYAIMAIKGHGPVRGGWLALKRILRCHPWSKGGCDLPPEAHRH